MARPCARKLSLLLAIAALAFTIGQGYLQSSSAAAGTPSNPAMVATPAFVVARAVPVAGSPAAVAAGDLNNDGNIDLVVANAQADTVEVFLGTGGGNFSEAVKYAVGKTPIAVVVGDFNGDGKPDVAVANQAGDSVSVLLGNGDGTLQAAVNYPVPKGPSFLAIADLHGQGHLDLLVASASTNSVAVLRNNGDGSFQNAVQYNLGAAPRSIAVGDFNGDGKPDLASANSDGSVTILLGDGQGGFQGGNSYKIGTALSAVVVADLNHDGHLDLAVADSSANTVQVLLGDGSGAFKSAATVNVGNEPVSLAVADLNGDGTPDLIAANRSDNTVSILVGKGDGSFASSADFVVGNAPMMAIVADLSGHGHFDLATANFLDGSISIAQGNGDGTFQAAQNYRTNLDRQAVAAGDLNGDGRLDLVVTNFCGTDASCTSSGTATVFLNNGNGTFRKGSSIALGKGPVAIALGDINGDKKLDLVIAHQNDNTVTVMLGNGDGTFQPGLTTPVGNSPVAIAIADFNKDGKADVIVANRCGSDGCSGPGEVNVLLGNGDGSFQTPVSYPVGFSPAWVTVGDLNGDGNPDVVVANACGKSNACTSGTASVLIGDGKGKFSPGADVSLGKLPSSVALGDLTGKGTLDLVAAYSGDNQVAVLLSNGDGTFKNPVVYAVGSAPSSVVTGDFSGHGHTDVAVANLKSSTVSVLAGNGDRTLQNAVHYPVGSQPGVVIAAALTASGRPDIVSANGATGTTTASSNMTVLRNAAVNPLATSVSVSGSPNPSTYGQAVTFTATATAGATGDIVTFNDTFNSVTTTLGTGTLNAGGTATFTTGATQLAAGTHSITATDGATSAPLIQMVNTAPITATLTPSNKTYDGTNTEPDANMSCSLTGVLAADSANVSCAASSGTFNSSQVATANTVTATVTISGTAAGNYTLGAAGTSVSSTTVTGPASITPKALTESGLSVPASKVYDGTTAAVVSGTAALPASEPPGNGSTSDGRPYIGDTVSISGTATGTYNSKDVLTATTVTFGGLSLSGAQASDYTLTALTQPATITSKALTESGLSVPASKVYDGTTAAVVSGTAALPASEPPGNGSTSDGRPYIGDTVSITGTAAGTYNNKDVLTATTVTFGGLSLAGGQASDYTLTFQNAAAATITAKALTGSGLLVPASKVYDGTTAAVVSGTSALPASEPPGSGSTSDGKPYNVDTVSIAGTATGTYNSKDVVTATTVTFSGLSLTGGQASDYTLAIQNAAAATITAKALTGSGLLVPASKVYDGTTGAVVSGTATLPASEPPGSGSTSDGKPYNVDTVSITGTATGTYNSKDVDTATTVALGGPSLNGGQASDYALTIQNASARITPATLTIVADSKTRIYGEANPMFTGTVTGFVLTETQATATTGTLSFSTAAVQCSNVGSYAINGSGLTANHGNYNFVQATGNTPALTVNAATTTSSVSAAIIPTSTGATITFTSTVLPQFSCAPTGKVAYSDTGACSGTGCNPTQSLTGGTNSATAAYSVDLTQLSTDKHIVKATYDQSDPNFSASTSAIATELTVGPPQQKVRGQLITPISLAVINEGTVGITVNKWSCAVLQPGTPPPVVLQTTCQVSSNATTLPPGGSADLTVTITTSNATTAMIRSRSIWLGVPALVGLAFFGLTVPGGLGSRSRRHTVLRVLGLALMLCALLVAGCGGGFSNPTNLPPSTGAGTPPGTYVVEVTYTDSQNNTVPVAGILMNVSP